MSRVFYEFATSTGTSWTQSISCDLCKMTVERVGALPKREFSRQVGDAHFEPGALIGWAHYSQRVRPKDPKDPLLKQDEDLWPRLDRDLCPSCAGVVHDRFLEWGVGIATTETRYLDSAGRKIGGRTEAMGIELCGEDCGDRRTPCLREKRHAGGHEPTLAVGLTVCPACSESRMLQVGGTPAGLARPEWRGFTDAQLTAHAVDQHNVVQEDDARGTRPAGWVTTLETPRVAYADVVSALRAELKLLRHSESLAPLVIPGSGPGGDVYVSPGRWIHLCGAEGGRPHSLDRDVICQCGARRHR